MAGRFVTVTGGLLLAAALGAFVAERAGWFDTAGWRDALPGLGAGETTPPAGPAADAVPAPEDRPPQETIARPARKPAPDAVAPARKPEIPKPTRTAESAPAGADEPATPDTASEETTAQTDPGAAADAAAGQTPEDREPTRAADADGPAADDRDADDRSTGDPDDGSPGAADVAARQTDVTDGDAGPTADRSAASKQSTDTTADPAARTGQPADDDPAVRDPDSGMQLTVPARDGLDDAPAGVSVAQVPMPDIPSFDIVRVERSDEAVIAGRAPPRSRVTVLQGDQPIATAEANERGEFVAIPHRPLPPGQRQLTLQAEDPDSGERTESDRAVVIDIPRMPNNDRPQTAAATQSEDASDGAAETGAQVTASRTGETPASGPRSESGDNAGGDATDRTTASASSDDPSGAGARGQAASNDPASGSSRERETVAVRDNRPTAEPPLLTDGPETSRETDPRSGDPADTQTAGDPLTIPAPPAGGDDADAPAATVTDVPEPAGGAPKVTTRTADSESDGGARVSARQDTSTGNDGSDRTATRALRPQASALTQDSSGDAPSGDESGGGSRGDKPIAVLVPREGTGEVEVLQRPSGETGLADRELVLEAVQYTVDGGISISGRAPSEALVVAYLNEMELARTRAPADGSWTMAPKADVPPGLHTLRIDQVGPDGQVQASVSTPFANQPMVDDLDENEGMVVIQPGDNLWTIARRTYGQGWEYTLIYRANRDQIGDPDLIYPGQVFVVPEDQRREAGSGE